VGAAADSEGAPRQLAANVEHRTSNVEHRREEKLEKALVRRAARVRMERAGVRLSVQDGLRVGRRWMALMDAAVRTTGQDFVSAMASGPVIFLGTSNVEHRTSNVEGRERSAA